jgi:hypothetical protein
MKTLPLVLACLVVGVVGMVAPDARAQYGFDFVTIGSPGNAAYNGEPKFGTLPIGRGSVGYEYKSARWRSPRSSGWTS